MNTTTKTKKATKSSIDPATFRTAVYQHDLHYDTQGEPYTTEAEVTVETDAEDYTMVPWSELSDKDRREANDWTEELHDAEVALARADAKVRATAKSILEDCSDYDADTVRAALKHAKAQCKSGRNGHRSPATRLAVDDDN